MKKVVIYLLLLSVLVFFAPLSVGANSKTQCNVVDCDTNSKVISYATKSDPYYACPTQELSDYTNFVLGLISFGYQMTGKFPNVSPVTGEPEYEGQTKSMLDTMRSAAGVGTFDQAVSECKIGKNRLRLRVLNNPQGGVSIWVLDDRTKKTFWMPKTHLDLR